MDRLDKKTIIKIAGVLALSIGLCYTLIYIYNSDPDSKYYKLDICEGKPHVMMSYSVS